jgi:LAO/AO transport system kinase
VSAVAASLPPLTALRGGGKRAMAMALARLEAAAGEPQTLALLDGAYAGARAHVIGLTGPPGVGKSTLLSRLIEAYRQRGRTVGAITIDPSSRRSGGALLGDRARIEVDPEDQGVFVRSKATRGRLGGLAALTPAAVVLMRAVYDQVIVETVGVGQSETEVAAVSDSVVFCVQPGSGDSLQYMKAGIAEIPDVVVVGKADLGASAHKAQGDVEAALQLAASPAPDWRVPVHLVSAQSGQGIDELIDLLAAHADLLAREHRLARRRETQAATWLRDALRDEFGRHGLARAEEWLEGLAMPPGVSPFRQLRELARDLRRESGTSTAFAWHLSH